MPGDPCVRCFTLSGSTAVSVSCYTGYIGSRERIPVSYISDAVRGVCAALDQCFTTYDDGRHVSTSVRYPMGVAAVVDFSITARGFEVYGSLAVVVDVVDWSGICFVADLSGRSRRWLKHGPINIGAHEVILELVSACSDTDYFDLVVPPTESTTSGFRFDLAVA